MSMSVSKFNNNVAFGCKKSVAPIKNILLDNEVNSKIAEEYVNRIPDERVGFYLNAVTKFPAAIVQNIKNSTKALAELWKIKI